MQHQNKENTQAQHHEQNQKNWYDKNYKLLMAIPVIMVVISLVYLFMFYSKNNDFIYRDVSLSGGTTITLNGNINAEMLEKELKSRHDDLNFRKLTDLRTGSLIAVVIESAAESETLKKDIEEILEITLTAENSSIEFSGSSLSENFYKQLITALIISFILMSFVIFILFRTFIPSIAVIFAAFSDIVMPLALLNYFSVKISAAGIAAFLVLIGYSVDTDILLTTRALKTSEGTLNSRIYKAFKTGIFMTITALIAVLPAFFLVTGLPDSFRQIFLILALGLSADILNTWLTNAGILKWYCGRKGIK